MTGWRAGEPTLADIQAEFPRWHCFQGMNGLYYAQYVVTGDRVSGEDPVDLRDQIKAAESQQSNSRHTQDSLLCQLLGDCQLLGG